MAKTVLLLYEIEQLYPPFNVGSNFAPAVTTQGHPCPSPQTD